MHIYIPLSFFSKGGKLGMVGGVPRLLSDASLQVAFLAQVCLDVRFFLAFSAQNHNKKRKDVMERKVKRKAPTPSRSDLRANSPSSAPGVCVWGSLRQWLHSSSFNPFLIVGA